MPVIVDDADRRDFLDNLGELVSTGQLVVHAFCMMPNHYYLVCETPLGGLGRWMREVTGVYARVFNRRHHRVDHLWQARYKAILVENGPYSLECSQYILLNPNRSRLTRVGGAISVVELSKLCGWTGLRGLGSG